MAWLIDTDLLSERTKKQPDTRVLKWLEEHASEIYTSSHVIGELQAGISLLPEGAKRRALQAWLNRLIEAMKGRILNFNASVAAVWGRQEAEFGEKGCPMPMPDRMRNQFAYAGTLAIRGPAVSGHLNLDLKNR
jgi:toxin FitB